MKANLSLFLAALTLTGCFPGKLATPDLSKFKTDMKVVETSTLENGSTAGTYDPNSKISQLIGVGGNSAISGSSVSLPPGALGISTRILIEEAMPLATDVTISQLAINGSAVNSGTSVSVQSEQKSNMKLPMTLQLPLPIGYGLRAGNEANLAILYRVEQSDGTTYAAGIIPRSKITIQGKFAKFETKFFGAYQVIEFSQALEATEVAVISPATTKSTVDKNPALSITHMSEIVAQSGCWSMERIFGVLYC